MPRPQDVLLLTADDAVVTFGAQFREVALGLLITQLNPAASSYAWYFLVGSIPGLIFAHLYAWASVRFAPRRIMTASYVLRLLLVLGLWRAENFWAALVLLGGLSAGSGIYSASQAHYVATPGDYGATRRVVMRLRQSSSAMRLMGPLVAGAVLSGLGFRAGFLVSGGAYVLALMAVSFLSDKPAPISVPSFRIEWRPDAPAMAILGLSLLTWQANSLAMAYTFHILHRQAFGYGMTLAVWGGSGLLASMLLHRIQIQPLRWIGPLFVSLGVAWLILGHGVSFPVFVLLGGAEGTASWLIQDLVIAHLLSHAAEGRAGVARARLGVFDKIGAILGTAGILVMPVHWLILPLYRYLGSAGILVGLVWVAIPLRSQRTE